MSHQDYQTVKTSQLVITQENSLVYAAYEMTLQEKRLLLLLISMVRQDHTKFHTYCIPVKQIAEFLEIDKKRAYKVVNETCNKLMSRVLHVQKSNGDWDKFHWVSRARYRSKGNSKTGEAELELKIHDELHPMLLELKKQFASVPFEHVANLPSYHSIRLFEILFHKSQGFKRASIRIYLHDLKKSLGIENSYPNYADFKRRVLEPAKKNLANKTPLKFTYTSVKEGRKVAALDFVVTKNQTIKDNQLELGLNTPRTIRILKIDSLESEVPSQHQDLIKELAQMSYTGNGLELIKQIGEQEVRDVLELAKEQQNKNKGTENEIHNMGGFINHLIETEAWKLVALQRKAKEDTYKEAKDTHKKTSHTKKVKQLVESTKEEYSKACLAYKEGQWKQFSASKKKRIVKEIKLNGGDFVNQFLNSQQWSESGMFFTNEAYAAMERLGIPFAPPLHLESEVNYIQSQPQYQNIEPEIIEGVIAAFSA